MNKQEELKQALKPYEKKIEQLKKDVKYLLCELRMKERIIAGERTKRSI